ncbi:MAG: LacI family DNA-binding transcriptional regulator [Fimbriimonas sp.]
MKTLEDIARQAGVSHSTVSRALADSQLVNPQTKERIRLLAAEAGYQVNQVARNLKSRSTQTIGLVVPEVSNPYYPKLIQQVADEAKEAGFSLQLHLSGRAQEAEIECVASLRSHRADGILIVTAEHGLVARTHVNALAGAGTPVVLMGWVPDADHLDYVTGDDAKGGFDIAQHLLALGHRRISILGKPPHRGGYDRIVGFKWALSKAGIEILGDENFFVREERDVEEGVRRLLQAPTPPTAIFAYQDSIAVLVYKALAEVGISVPNDMTVVGFDDIDLASYLSPRLTTVGTHIQPLASAFVRLLVARIRGELPEDSPQHVVITPRLIVRGSCAPPRQLDSSIGDN